MASKLHIQLLGSPSVAVDDQPITRFHSSKVAALVYFLAATARKHGRDTLAALFWGDLAEIQAKKNLRNSLYYLPDALKPAIAVTRDAVQLLITENDVVDCLDFQSKLAVAEKLPKESSEWVSQMEAAAELVQGEFLQGFHCEDVEGFDEWQRGERERFALLAAQVFNDLLRYHASQHNYLQGINYATRLLVLDPLNEETQRNLMTMLALSGQQNAALAQYRTCQQLLADELGVDPDEETSELFERIQAGEFSIQEKIVFSPTQPATLPTNIPGELAEFINRKSEIEWIRQQLLSPNIRLVTLTGMGGIGKTRLALHIARGFLDTNGDQSNPFVHGVFWVALAALEANEHLTNQIASGIAEAIRLPLSGSDSPFNQVANALADKSILLLLDNFEQLTLATPAIARLLQKTQRLKVLVTSRTRLNLYGEQTLPLEGLASPTLAEITQHGKHDEAAADTLLARFAAPRLFLQTARSIAPNFRLSSTAQQAIVRTCRMMEGLPLGIELAASWTRILPCDEIVSEIQRDLDFLAPTSADAPAGQRSLRAVFNHSWRLLSSAEQQTLRRLAIFRGSFTRQAASIVTESSLLQLVSLVDKSLLRRVDMHESAQQDSDENLEAQQGRYELQEMIRQFAAEQLAASGEQERMTARHARYYRDLLISMQSALRSEQQYTALRQIALSIENIRAAINWFNQQLAAGVVTNTANAWQAFDTLFNYLDMRSWFQEGETVFRQTLAAVNMQMRAAQSDDWRILAAQLQARQGWFLFHLARYAESERLMSESLQTLRALDAQEEQTFNLNYLGAIYRHQGQLELAEKMLNEALQLADDYDDPHGASIALNILGQVATLRNDFDTARQRCGKAIEIKRSIGDRWGMTYSLTYLGRVEQAQRHYGEARTLFEESLAIYQELGDRRGIAFATQNLGDIAYRRGDYTRARQYYQESLHLYRDIGNRLESSLTLARLGDVACAQQEFEVGEVSTLEALRLADEIHSAPAQVSALLALAALTIADRRPDEAIPLLRLIYLHPAASQEQRERSEQLWMLTNQADPQPIQTTTQATDGDQSLEAVVKDLLKA